MKDLQIKKLVKLEVALLLGIALSILVALYGTLNYHAGRTLFWEDFSRIFIVSAVPLLLAGVATWLTKAKNTFIVLLYSLGFIALFSLIEIFVLYLTVEDNDGLGFLMLYFLIFFFFDLFTVVPFIVLANSENVSWKKASKMKKIIMPLLIVAAVVILVLFRNFATLILAYYAAIWSLFHLLYNDGEKHQLLQAMIGLMLLFAIFFAIAV